MGIFYEQEEVVNRTSKRLYVRFDGQDMPLEPNYDDKGTLLKDVHNAIPAIAVAYAKSQNVLMGSEDPMDPSSFTVLVGVKAKKGVKQKDAITYLEQDETCVTRVRLEEYLDDPSLKITVGGRRIRVNDAREGITKTPWEGRPS